MKQLRLFFRCLSPPGNTLETVSSSEHLKLFCKYMNNNNTPVPDNTHHRSPETVLTIERLTSSNLGRKRKKRRMKCKAQQQHQQQQAQYCESNPTNAFHKAEPSTKRTAGPASGVLGLLIVLSLALLCPPIGAQSNETGHSLTLSNGTTLSNSDNVVSAVATAAESENTVGSGRRSNTRLSVLNYDTTANTTQQHYRSPHYRSYHFAKVLLLPVQASSSGFNESILTSSGGLSIPVPYGAKHGSIKRKRSGRYRRLTPAGNVNANSALHSFHPKSKSGSNQIPGLGPLPSSSIPGQNRLKILPGGDLASQIPFGPVVPDSKCNYELYPSGCFDENGSVCDSSAQRCVCRPGHSIQLEGLYCLRPATIGEACYTTEQCERRVAHSGCFNYREEYRLEHPSAFFGPAQSSWPMGECRCRAGYRHEPSLGACTPALIGAWCSNAWDCQDPTWAESGSHLHHSSKPGHGSYHHGGFHNRSSGSLFGSHHGSGSGSISPGGHRKTPNVVCDGNVCACASFFHFNESAVECQYRETYGRTCKPHEGALSSSSASSDSSSSSSTNQELPIKCNPPSICSVNGTCVCPDNFEYQPNARPQCQRLKGQSSANLFGSSGRPGKGDGFFDFDKGSSGFSNFIEYVLYVLIPALLIIFALRPCFRRIGEWRNHVHQYASDADFFQGFTRPVMSVAEMNALQTAAEKGVSSTAAATFTFDPCHSPYLFDSAALVDSCFGFTPAAHTSAYGHHRPSLGPNDPSLALVREKLQTIEESQSESGGENGNTTATVAAAAAATTNSSLCRCGAVAGVGNCCETQIDCRNDNESGKSNQTSASLAKTQDGTHPASTATNPVDDVNNHDAIILSQQTPQESIVDSL